ncbi:hypothetical protein Golomagni_06747 [Golovinomyces magnicellulatus]|nr:hypothetical protein Golomagni_06747 [Golovinomyces magnicellulatus]
MGMSAAQAGDNLAAAEELWRHSDPASTPMWKFLQQVNKNHGVRLNGYPDLYKWSVENVAEFWHETWQFVGIKASTPYDQVLPPNAPMYPRPDFFGSARLNFAENLLFPPADPAIDPASTAVITTTELPGDLRSTTWAELREAVRRCANGLRASGLKPHDVVAGYVSNHVEALVAMLSAASIGAIWTGISPDNGVSAVLDRLSQIAPKVLFADNGTVYNGKEWSSTSKTTEIVGELKKAGLQTVIVINNIKGELGMSDLEAHGVKAVEYASLNNYPPLTRSTFSTPVARPVFPRPLYTLLSAHFCSTRRNT